MRKCKDDDVDPIDSDKRYPAQNIDFYNTEIGSSLQPSAANYSMGVHQSAMNQDRF